MAEKGTAYYVKYQKHICTEAFLHERNVLADVACFRLCPFISKGVAVLLRTIVEWENGITN